VFQLPPVYHDRMVADGGPESFAQLPAIPATNTARNLALAIYAEAAEGARSGSAYARSLSDALLHYALEWLPPKPMRVHGGFSEGQRRNLLRYIDAHLDKTLTLDEIAAQAGLRPRHFTTLFRAAFGATPHRFLIERRLERAAQLLISSRLPLTEIALHVGFASHSHFAAAFRRHYGVSPGRYANHR
jgi:AraC family transcriptional regulator